MVQENTVTMNDVVYPLFIVDGENIRKEISSMKDQFHISVDMLGKEVCDLYSTGIKAFILFGVPDQKDAQATPAFEETGLVQQGIKAIKEVCPDAYVITDVCLCEYKSDGHCCFFDAKGDIDREKTLKILSQTALSHAEAGADMVAPSDMMDGRIDAIRNTLDKNRFESIPIMSYSAKYASSFYGPFREAAHSAPSFGDRRSYQMNPANSEEAVKEMLLDIEEGADIIMVKPAMPYQDIIYKAKEITCLPIAAYQVSGEYAMIKGAIDNGLLAEKAIYESLLGIKRSGASIIITYFAKELPRLIKEYGI
jgi:porphobilinogen synthase